MQYDYVVICMSDDIICVQQIRRKSNKKPADLSDHCFITLLSTGDKFLR